METGKDGELGDMEDTIVRANEDNDVVAVLLGQALAPALRPFAAQERAGERGVGIICRRERGVCRLLTEAEGRT